MKNSEAIWYELRHHLPFTLAVSLFAGFVVAIFYSVGRVPSEVLFEVLHPAHVLVSAVATSAIYWKYKKSVRVSLVLGVLALFWLGHLVMFCFHGWLVKFFHLRLHCIFPF